VVEAPRFACKPEWPLNGKAANEEWEHIVWLGDSLTRYEYLQLAWINHLVIQPNSTQPRFDTSTWFDNNISLHLIHVWSYQRVYQIHTDGLGEEDARMGGWGGKPIGTRGGNFLVNERTYGDWTMFLKQTSEIMFNANDSMMTCDCWRDEPRPGYTRRVADYKENRYYVKRRTGPGQKNIALSFYWW